MRWLKIVRFDPGHKIWYNERILIIQGGEARR